MKIDRMLTHTLSSALLIIGLMKVITRLTLGVFCRVDEYDAGAIGSSARFFLMPDEASSDRFEQTKCSEVPPRTWQNTSFSTSVRTFTARR